MRDQIHFLHMSDLEGYVFNPHRPEGLTFSDPKDPFTITIRSQNEPEGYRAGYDNLKLRATTEREATAEQIEFVEALIEGTYLRELGQLKKLPLIDDSTVLIDEGGKIAKGYSPTWDMLPPDLQELGMEAHRFLRDRANRFVQLLRWQQAAVGPVEILREPRRSPIIYWRTSHESYHLAPLPKQETIVIVGRPNGGLVWDKNEQDNFSRLWKCTDAREPLGHQLLREAEAIRYQNPRSALLITYSALEVGIKQHIAECARDAAWLAMFSPTPPLFKILRDYLPQLHAAKENFAHWSNINKRLKKINEFTEDRNRLAHRGEEISGSLDDYITITADLLYSFDVFEGHDWAKSKVSREFRSALRW